MSNAEQLVALVMTQNWDRGTRGEGAGRLTGKVFDMSSWVRSEARIWGSLTGNRGALGICSAEEPHQERDHPKEGVFPSIGLAQKELAC